jgi:2,4-dienoyl-CoA reductase-like NADH-dependent reductase (Old Yellow Enzyme family)
LLDQDGSPSTRERRYRQICAAPAFGCFKWCPAQRPAASGLKGTLGIGWRYRPAANLDHALAFKDATGLPIIANGGGFQFRDQIESALQSDKCDLLAMARPLLTNPDLMDLYRKGVNAPARPCTHCNRCSIGTAVLPLGCYDRSRFDSQRAMEGQILWLSGGPIGEESADHYQTQ